MATATPARARPPTIIAARAHPVLVAEIKTLFMPSVAPRAQPKPKLISAFPGRESVNPRRDMAAQMGSVERFSFTIRCCYTMVRALSAVIVMAESVSGSYLTDRLAF
jgi:hypothetical protein